MRNKQGSMKTIKGRYENITQDTKKDIIKAARRLFSEYSYLGVSMADIAKKINVSKAALYYHFASKAEIYGKVLDEVFNDLNLSIREALNKTTIDKRLYKFVKSYLSFSFKEKNLIKALVFKTSSVDSQTGKHIMQLRKQIVGLVQSVIEEVSMDRKITRKANNQISASLLIGTMDGLILKYSFLNKKISSGKVAKQIIAAFFVPMAKADSGAH